MQRHEFEHVIAAAANVLAKTSSSSAGTLGGDVGISQHHTILGAWC